MKRKIINWLFFAAGIIFILYYLACGIGHRFEQSMLWVWPVTGVAFLIRFAIVYISIKRDMPLPYPKWMINLVRAFCLVCLMCFLVVECFVFSGFFSACPENVDYVILLGAKTGSITIDRRIDTAAEYLMENPETMVVCTGGQGSDEEMPEGEYMRRGLVQRGISEDRIIVETKSTSTAENLKFSSELIEKDSSVVIVSNNYHIFRAMAIARNFFTGEIYGIPMASNWLTLPHYMVREFFTVTVDGLRGNLVF